MTILLDTHIFLWLISNNSRLSERHRQAICNSDNILYLSVASVWEATIKYQLGKLPLPESPATYLPQQRERHQLVSLPIAETTITQLTNLPPIHRDPFDRLLLCQALEHNLTIMTEDTAIMAYPLAKIF
jgi:PIN domain nuclease of toxin-antitoxin system